MDNKITSVIQYNLSKHIGGSKFFDHFDADLTSYELRPVIIKVLTSLSNQNIILSGKFGIYIKHLISERQLVWNKNICFVKGSLRGKDRTIRRFESNHDISKQNFLFVDDSFYSGKTWNAINSFLKDHNSSIENGYVIYDGSKVKPKNLKSMWRYYSC